MVWDCWIWQVCEDLPCKPANFRELDPTRSSFPRGAKTLTKASPNDLLPPAHTWHDRKIVMERQRILYSEQPNPNDQSIIQKNSQ